VITDDSTKLSIHGMNKGTEMYRRSI